MKFKHASLFLKLFCGLLLAVTADAQDTATTQPPPTTKNGSDARLAVNGAIETLRNQVTESQLSEEEKKPLLDSIAQAEAQAKEAEAKVTLARANQASLASLPTRVEAATAPQPTPAPPLPKTATLAELESLLLNAESQVVAAKQALIDAEAVATKATQRRREIEVELPKLTTQLAERQTQIDAATAAPDTTLAGQTRRLELDVSGQLLQAQIDALRSEAALIDAETTSGFYQIDRDLKAAQVEALQAQQQLVKDRVEQQRAQDAAEQLQAAEAQISTLDPVLLPIGQRNKELAKLNQDLAVDIETYAVTLEQRNKTLEDLREQIQQAKNRVTSVGLTDAVGAMLRNLKQNLPRVGVYRLRAGERQLLINSAQYELIELTEQRNARLDVAVELLLSSAAEPVPLGKYASVAEEARTLFTQQRTEFLDPAIRSQTTYFNSLVSLSTTEQQIVQLVNEATIYINELVLWIRSTKPLTSQLVPPAEERWFLISTVWNNVGPRLRDDVLHRPFFWLAAALAFAVLIRFRWRFRSEIQELGKRATQSTCTDFGLTIRSLMLTIAAAAPAPLVLAFLASRLGSVAGNDRALLALAEATRAGASLLFPIELLRQICRPDGLAVCHFGWSANTARFMRHRLRVLSLTLVPLLMITGFLRAGGYGYGRDTLERYFFIAAMVVFAIFLSRVMHPRRGLVGNYLRRHTDGWADQLSYVWYPLLVMAPVVLAVLAFAGYFFTSQQLALRIHVTLCLLLGFSIATAIILRWVIVHRRKLRIEQARQQRAQVEPGASAEAPVEPQSLTAEQLQLQMQQTRRLVQTSMIGVALVCVWFVWSDVLTARSFLENWPVWQSTETITETVNSDKGDPITRTREVPENITVADLAVAILIMTLTVFAMRNLPGLLEFAVLRRLPLDNSIRYAITTLFNYAIALLGLIIAGQTVGLHWNQIQWMATALTFGLAFGLQEVFANFVAGIIILFEQPVRVGDVVEIDGVTGVVNRIRIRATTITDWNRKDYIVPNKEFITGKVLNWTRSDEINRAVINVGVAYGTDTDQARELLLKVVHDHPHVLDDPAPQATFEEFGDNSLNFVVRAFIGDLSKRLTTIHDLHTAINKTFAQAGIEISFPQRDLHLRSIPDSILQTFAARAVDQGQSHNRTEKKGAHGN